MSKKLNKIGIFFAECQDIINFAIVIITFKGDPIP